VIAADDKGEPSWTIFHDESPDAHAERLCQVCGERLKGAIVLGRIAESDSVGEELTSGPGCHPRCMALALRFCPHFREDDAVVAYLYTGPGSGYVIRYSPVPGDEFTDSNRISPDATPLSADQVRELAREDPLGLETAAVPALA
jgi:hypothetical protein